MLRIGIAGLGTVGGGVFKALLEHKALYAQRCGTPLVVTAVSARNRDRDRGFSIEDVTWYDDPVELAQSADVDIVVEVIGGDSGPAYDVCYSALNAGKHVVTANKALIAHHGMDLARCAKERGVQLRFEAAVAGGIPVIKGFKEGLSANRIESFLGILNGTCNFILSNMEDTQREFSVVLEEAQALGYAEADPSFDVDGVDTAHKLAILSSIAFGTQIDFGVIPIEGIRAITPMDITYARELGYRIKLLAVGVRGDGVIQQRVRPCLVKNSSSIAKVSGVDNAVFVHGDLVGDVLLEGPGAGEMATASSVIADVIDVASARADEPFGIGVDALVSMPTVAAQDYQGEYYLRFSVADQAGVLSAISEVLKESNISLETIVQRPSEGGCSNIVAITHAIAEHVVIKALEKIQKLDSVVEKPQIICIKH